MLTALRTRLTYANVIASIALFVALGGTGYAAIKLPKNSVGNKQLKANSVTDKKVKNGSLGAGDFKSGQVLTPGAAGSRFLEEGDASKFLAQGDAGRFLGKGEKAASAGNADTLGGQGAGAFVQGGGRRIAEATGGIANPGGNTTTNIAIPGFGNIEFACLGASYSITYRNSTGSGTRLWERRLQSDGGATPPLHTDVAPNGAFGVGNPDAGNTPGDEIVETSDVHLVQGSRTAQLQVFSSHRRDATASHATCSASLAGVTG